MVYCFRGVSQRWKLSPRCDLTRWDRRGERHPQPFHVDDVETRRFSRDLTHHYDLSQPKRSPRTINRLGCMTSDSLCTALPKSRLRSSKTVEVHTLNLTLFPRRTVSRRLYSSTHYAALYRSKAPQVRIQLTSKRGNVCGNHSIQNQKKEAKKQSTARGVRHTEKRHDSRWRETSTRNL